MTKLIYLGSSDSCTRSVESSNRLNIEKGHPLDNSKHQSDYGN